MIADDLRRVVAAAVPEMIEGAVARPRRRIPLLDAAMRATSGNRRQVVFDVSLPVAGKLRLIMPDRPDLAVGRVIGALASVEHIARTYPRLAIALRILSFDASRVDADENIRWEGLASGSLGQISLRADLFIEAPAHVTDDLLVVAHECWHQLEFDLEAREYRTSIELRRRVGAHFGVETIEHAVRGRAPKAPPEWTNAYARVWAEVSPYATSGPKETTAELFSQWWACRVQGRERTAATEMFDRVLTDLMPPT